MKLSQYLAAERGRGAAVAAALNVAPQQVYQWASGTRPVPVERCASIEAATHGDVTRRDLRPDDWEQIWPELAKRGRRATDLKSSP